MNLYNIVYQLVCDNDCVIIPGFGGFVTNRFPANVDFSKQEFYPPSRKVAFNENLSLSDGLLVNHLSQTENVSWAEAELMVKSFVDDLNKKLSDGNTLTFDELGSFSRRTGSLVFVPNSANLLDEAFGLASFNFPMLPSESKTRIESAIVSGKKDKKKKPKVGRAIAWSLSSAAVIGGLICLSVYMGWFDHLFGNNSNDNTIFAGFGVGGNAEQIVESTDETIDNKQNVNLLDAQEIVADETEAIETPLEDVVANEEIMADEAVVTEDPVVADVETPVVETSNNIDYKVHIIAGCFANRSNAENVYNDLVSKGLSPQILPLQKGLYKVSVKGFANTADACAELQGLKEQTGNESLWVMKL